MDRSDVITLIATTITQDENGVEHATLTERDVFCQVDSITRAEFFDAGRSGLNPEYRFTLFSGDYQGEQLIRYNGMTYGVYRTYKARRDELELYAERKGGSNGK